MMAIWLLVLAGCAGSGGDYKTLPNGVVVPPSSSVGAHGPREPRSAFRTIMLDTHNAERVAMGVRPLVWNTKLEADARDWAEHLAKTGRFEHAPQSPDYAKAQGENLWMGTKDAYSFRAMVSQWIGEKAQFRAGLFPQVSRSGQVHDVGHYTQVIWGASREVGCALASNAVSDYLVCRYAPVGNVNGRVVLDSAEPGIR